jgi:hypothetical protein
MVKMKYFLKCKRITKLDIPNGVTEIGFRAFSLNKAVGITRRIRAGQFQLPYVFPAA